MTDYFVGRKSELDMFRSCLGVPQNGVYYYGMGGIGKTQLLKRIITLSRDELGLKTSALIDFFSTRNHSIEGLQTSIMEQIGDSQHFQEILDLRQELQEARNQGGSTSSQLIASLQRRIEVLFSSCCNASTKDRFIVLVLDSFEYVQERDVGHWFLYEFLPEIKASSHSGLIIVLAGRSKPIPADTPMNVVKHPLGGLGRKDIIDYVERIGIQWHENLSPLHLGTQGNPLLIELIRWRGRPELMMDRQKLEEIVGDPEAMAREIFDEVARPSPLNRVLWAMATLKRRFDFDMLEYLVNTMRWLGEDVDFDAIHKALQNLPFVKSEEAGTSHLLHDEAIEPITIVFNGIAGFVSLKDELYQKIIQGYYPEQIKASQDSNERMYLQVEQFGYILDQDWDEGVALYRIYREAAKLQSNYDFEELLWGELYEYLMPSSNTGIQDQGLGLMHERSKWLLENGLHNKREHLLRLIHQTSTLKPEERLDAGIALGFTLMRQGKLDIAEKYLRDSLESAQRLGSRDSIAIIENNLGQLMAVIGRHTEAVEYYWHSLKGYQMSENPDRIAAAYSARGVSLAMLGQYDRALNHCFYALQILEKYPNIWRQVYALRFTGVVYQLMGNYQTCISYLSKALQLAERENFIEIKAEILYELGRSSYLHGHQAWKENQSFSVDCSNQSRAVNALLSSLEQARHIYHRSTISKNLIQLAYVFEEIVNLEEITRVDDGQYSDNNSGFSIPMLQALITQVQDILILEDAYWFQRGLEHFPDKRFNDLALRQKTVRLFELGFLEAATANQFSLEIEGRIESARVLLELGLFAEVESAVRKIKTIRLSVYDDRALLALGTLILADLAFDRGDLSGALLRYAQAIPMLASVQGQAAKLVNTRIDELFKRIRLLESVGTAIEWCRNLQEIWLDAHVGSSLPSVIDRIQMLAHELHEKLV